MSSDNDIACLVMLLCAVAGAGGLLAWGAYEGRQSGLTDACSHTCAPVEGQYVEPECLCRTGDGTLEVAWSGGEP